MTALTGVTVQKMLAAIDEELATGKPTIGRLRYLVRQLSHAYTMGFCDISITGHDGKAVILAQLHYKLLSDIEDREEAEE